MKFCDRSIAALPQIHYIPHLLLWDHRLIVRSHHCSALIMKGSDDFGSLAAQRRAKLDLLKVPLPRIPHFPNNFPYCCTLLNICFHFPSLVKSISVTVVFPFFLLLSEVTSSCLALPLPILHKLGTFCNRVRYHTRCAWYVSHLRCSQIQIVSL